MPANLVATALSRSQIGLSWADNATNETGFRIERSSDGSTGWRQIGTVAANVTTYVHSRQPAFTTFFYRVRATNGTSNSAYSNVGFAKTLASAAGITSPERCIGAERCGRPSSPAGPRHVTTFR